MGSQKLSGVLLDTSFGDGGQIVLHQYVSSSIIDNDGRLLVAYTTREPGINNSNLVLARFDLAGNLDSGFGDNGIVTTPTLGQSLEITVDRFGQITVVGSYPPLSHDIFVARYSDDGEIDRSFGTEGITLTNFDGQFSSIRDVTLDQNGNLLLSGDIQTSTGKDFLVARYVGGTELNTVEPGHSSSPIDPVDAESDNTLLWVKGDLDQWVYWSVDETSKQSNDIERDFISISATDGWTAVDSADFDGDGERDILLRHYDTGENKVL